MPEAGRGDLVAAYDRLLNGTADPAVRIQASLDWTAWEDAILSLEEGYEVPHPGWADERYRIGFARLVTHYFAHAAFLEEDELLRNAQQAGRDPRGPAPWPAGPVWPARRGVAARRGRGPAPS